MPKALLKPQVIQLLNRVVAGGAGAAAPHGPVEPDKSSPKTTKKLTFEFLWEKESLQASQNNRFFRPVLV